MIFNPDTAKVGEFYHNVTGETVFYILSVNPITYTMIRYQQLFPARSFYINGNLRALSIGSAELSDLGSVSFKNNVIKNLFNEDSDFTPKKF
jgi:hypothetical protein